MKKKLIVCGLWIILIAALSCKKEETNSPPPEIDICDSYPIVLNDTLDNYATTSIGSVVYEYDLDNNGTFDGAIRLHRDASLSASHNYITIKAIDSNWSIIVNDQLEYICRDTFVFSPTYSCTNIYSCNSQDSYFGIDTIKVPTLIQEGEISDLSIQEYRVSGWIYRCETIYNNACSTSMAKGIFKDGINEGMIVFAKNNSELFTVRIENLSSCTELIVHEIDKIDCN